MRGDARAQDRFALVGGCYALKSAASGKFVVKTADGRYSASAGGAGGAEPFQLQATALGRYLFYGAKPTSSASASRCRAGPVADLAGPGPRPPGGRPPAGAGDRSRARRHRARPPTGASTGPAGCYFAICAPRQRGARAGRRRLRHHNLESLAHPAARERPRFTFEARDGCAGTRRSRLHATRRASRRRHAVGQGRGMIDAHMHMMAFEFLGGRAHCGRPWSPTARRTRWSTAPTTTRNGAGAVLENALSYGNPARMPRPGRLADLQGLAGTRLADPRAELLQVGRARLARRAAHLREPVRREQGALRGLSAQAERLRRDGRGAAPDQATSTSSQDYIDAQNGGPGKGWFRIVTTRSRRAR